jgi:IS30 family transposase
MPGARLTEFERGVIERGRRDGLTVPQIASVIGKHRTTVSRELNRGAGQDARRVPLRQIVGERRSGRRPVYRASVAQKRAQWAARRPKPCKVTGQLALVVQGLLEVDWSPQQIAAMLPILFPGDDGMRVSHETIYQSLFVQTRGELRRELTGHLRSQRTTRKPRGNSRAQGALRGLKGMVPISARPAEVGDRAVPGHWEGDLVLGGTGKGAVITLVERSTRFVLLAPLPQTHRSIDLREALTPMIASLPDALRRSLTWDQGKEMAQHATIAIEAGIEIYFCDPHSPWQRGTNENTNGLLRQYWPKGSDLRHLTQADCDEVALKLNTRPRETLGWKTPLQALNEALGATAA